MLRVLICIVLGTVCALAQAVDIQPLAPGAFEPLIARAPKPTLVVLWAQDCAPCHRELPQLARDVRFASVILINVDSSDATRELAAMLTSAGFPARTRAWVVAEADLARVRFEIDPAWRGETPRHYYYPTSGPRHAWSGPLEEGVERVRKIFSLDR